LFSFDVAAAAAEVAPAEVDAAPGFPVVAPVTPVERVLKLLRLLLMGCEGGGRCMALVLADCCNAPPVVKPGVMEELLVAVLLEDWREKLGGGRAALLFPPPPKLALGMLLKLFREFLVGGTGTAFEEDTLLSLRRLALDEERLWGEATAAVGGSFPLLVAPLPLAFRFKLLRFLVLDRF